MEPHVWLPELSQQWSEGSLNPLSEALRRRDAEGRAPLDLVLANPHENGLCFPEEALLAALRDGVRKARVYRPDPRGQMVARAALARYYERRGVATQADQIVLTPGTSMAYFYAFRLLCEPGDEVLVPRPGYPLFEDLSRMAGMKQRYYHYVRSAAGWRPDLEDLAFQCTDRTRVVALVSPHNPLGTVFSAEELETLAGICREKHLAVLFDEVFCEFLPERAKSLPRPVGDQFGLVVSLNGFSKMMSLPGYKIGWMRVDGAGAQVDAFSRALEYAADLFLPVAEPMQAAVEDLLEVGEREVIPRLAQAYANRRSVVERHLGDWLEPAQGGVYACLRLRGHRVDDEDLALRALEEVDVLVHPGLFYDLPGYLVMTCVARPDILEEGCRRLATWLRGQ